MKIMDTYNKGLESLNDSMDRFSSLLSTNAEKTRRVIINSILVIIILMVFGCFDFMTWKLDFSRMATSEYWTTIASKIVAGISSFNIGINANWDAALRRALELTEAIKLYDVLIKQKDDGNFDYYVETIYNPERKKRAYINKINRKIYRLNKFSRNRDKILYNKRIPENAENYELEVKMLNDLRARNKYCIKRKQLEYLKSKEYIDNNIESLNVKYTHVDSTIFDLEIDAKPKMDHVKVKGNIGLGKAKASSTVAWSMVVISMFTTSLIISINQQMFVDQVQAAWYYILHCLADAFIVFWYLFRGTRASGSIISRELTIPYTSRNHVLKSYIIWRIENNIEFSPSHKHINKLIDEENNTIEMSKEDFEKTFLKNEKC